MKRPRYEGTLLLRFRRIESSVFLSSSLSSSTERKLQVWSEKWGLYKIGHGHTLITCRIVSTGPTLLFCFTELRDALTSLSPTVTLNLLAWPRPLSLLPVL